MFDIFFGWRKASKCKKQIRKVQCRLKLLKNKRCSVVRQLREDVAQLIKLGYDQIALNRVEQLFEDESMMTVYELLDYFCDFVLLHFPYIRRNKDIPNDINEAVSSLIFASARCGDLPELRVIRELFAHRYGQRFAVVALELWPGNLVNIQIKEKLTKQLVPEDIKCRLVNEIARDYCLQPKVTQLARDKNHSVMEGREVQDLNLSKRTVYVDLLSSNWSTLARLSRSRSHQDSERTSTSISSSIVHQMSPRASEISIQKKSEDIGTCEETPTTYVSNQDVDRNQSIDKIHNADFGSEEEKMTGSPSSESLFQFAEERVVYLDDVEELSNFGDLQDQRLFKFRSSIQCRNSKPTGGCNQRCECQVKDVESRSSRKSEKASGKRSRRRSASREILFMNDIDCINYYGEQSKRDSCTHRKHMKKTPAQDGELYVSSPKQQKQPSFQKIGRLSYNLNHNSNLGGLEQSHYSCAPNAKGGREGSGGQEGKIRKAFKSRSYDGNDDEATVYHVFTYPNHWPNEPSQEMKNRFDSTEWSASNYPGQVASSSCARKGLQPPYLRAKTMPIGRKTENLKGKLMRSNTCQPQKHVHPKLPDYDDLEAKFLALKKEHLQTKRH